jgi:hypothetical protein
MSLGRVDPQPSTVIGHQQLPETRAVTSAPAMAGKPTAALRHIALIGERPRRETRTNLTDEQLLR